MMSLRNPWIVLSVSAALCASACKLSSNAEQPLREGGTPDAAAGDGGLGGQDGDDNFRPPIIPPPSPPPTNPPVAGSDAPIDAGTDAAHASGGSGAPAQAGSGAAAASGGQSVAGSAAEDSGPPPETEDDAGVEPPPCSEVGCLCDRMCERGLALGCEDEVALADCLQQCKTVAAGCQTEQLAAVTCKVESPDDAYICDDILWAFVVIGCEAQEAALQDCLRP